MPFPISEPSGVFTIVLATVVIVTYLSERAHVPTVVSITLAGIVLGPGVSGILDPAGAWNFLATIGLSYIFFSAGVGIDLSRFKENRKPVLVSGALGFSIPFLAGAAAGLWLFRLGIPASLMLGALLSSAGILSHPVLNRLGLTRHPAVVATLGGTLLANLGAVLALVMAGWALRGSTGAGFIAGLLPVALYLAGTALALPRLAGWFFRRVKADGTTEFVFMLAMAFLSAWLADLAGLEPFMGAFYAGLLLNRFIPDSSLLMDRLHFLGNSMLAPFFLLLVGARADLASMVSEPSALWMALGVAALAPASKWIAAQATGLALGFTRAEREFSFGLSTTYAALSLAVTAAAREMGLFNEAFFSGSVLLVVLSCIVGPLASYRSGRRLMASAEANMPPSGKFPERILVALSNPSSAKRLLDLAFMLRGKDGNEPVHPLAVVLESDDRERVLPVAEDMLAKAVVQGVAAQVPVIPVTRFAINIQGGVLQAAAEQRASVIVMGWNKPPRLSRAFFGSVIEQVVGGTRDMVAVVRAANPLPGATRILVIAPPLCAHHPGFARAVGLVSALASGLQAKTQLLTLKPHGKELLGACRAVGWHGPLQVLEAESWKELSRIPGNGQDRSRIFVILNARPGEESWHPAMERLPHRLGEDYPDFSLIALYLASPGAVGGWPASIPGAGETSTLPPIPRQQAEPQPGGLLRAAIDGRRVLVDMRQSAVADGLSDLLSGVFPDDRKTAGRITSLFTGMAQKQPLELEPGVLLLHARIPGITVSQACFGAHRAGFRISVLEEPVRILVLLLVPEDASPESHLATLGDIARLFREGDLARRLLAADRVQDLVADTGTD